MDLIFKALADPSRRELLDRLFQRQGQTLTMLIAGLPMRRQSAARHLKLLEEAGLLVIHWQGREKYHYLNPVPIAEINRRWIDKFSTNKADALAVLRRDLEEDDHE